MQLPRVASSSLQLESAHCLSSSRFPSSSGRSPLPFQCSVTNVAQLPQGRQCRRVEARAQPAALSRKKPHGNAVKLQESVGSTEPKLLAEPAVHFGELEQFYHVLNLSVQLSTPPPRSSQTPGGGNGKNDEFYANVGNAIRTLREEIPMLFQQDFTYDIYREDIVFRDPRNTFKGLKNYKLIFWSLRFHGRLFFSRLYVDVQRIWQPDDAQIRMRWTVHGIPRVPWKAEGIFDGVSTFKLDRKGKIYEHQVDNVILRDPPMLRSPLFAGLNLTPLLQPQPQTQPCPGAWCNNACSSADSLPSQPQAASTQQQPERADRGNSGGTVMQGLRGVLASDAEYLRRAFSEQSEVASLIRQERFPQPPCQT